MLKVGLVGYGFMGHMHAQCYVATGDASIAALADVDPAKRAEAREKYGCETFENIGDMLNSMELDIVDICVPTYLHEECVVSAVQKVKSVMCEKPMSTSVEGVRPHDRCRQQIRCHPYDRTGNTLLAGIPGHQEPGRFR